jgi:bifunctional UDP-N-acetylglucosamine pyrophosphorylase / glucosamine-1-phosphate N-acetyltransferase
MAKPSSRPLAAIVLAAGEGKRFRSAVPKVLHPLGGRPMLAWLLDAVTPLGATHTVVVVGRGADAVEEAAQRLSKKPLTFARQEQQLGTADAARVGDDALRDFDGDLLVVPGDTPLLTTKTLRALIAKHRKNGSAVTILSAALEDPKGYGRIVRDATGGVIRIVEDTDASKEERALKEINSGVYVFDRALMRSALDQVDRSNEQQEFYLTDIVEILHGKGEKILAIPVAEPEEILGINSRKQLADVEAAVRERINTTHMEAGVTIVDPAQTYIESTVVIGQDTVIHPPSFLMGTTVVGARCEIGPGARIKDSKIEAGARVLFSVLDTARVGPEATVGPYAYLRPGARLAKGAKVGTFVEVKGSTIGEGSKVPHLSYIGDAIIGKDVNIGAATVTVNYDAETRKKSKTTIGDEAKIGSDTMLVAPVKVGKRAVTGAGSVVTHDVAAETVVVGSPARPLRKRKKNDAEGEKH